MKRKLHIMYILIVYQIQRSIIEFIQEHCHILIRNKFPHPPPYYVKCPSCKKPLTKIIAIKDYGWIFFWECENNCGESEWVIDGWYPFKFGVWCNKSDLEKIGVEVVS